MQALHTFLADSCYRRNIAQKFKLMGKRVRLTSDSLNCYGTRIITAGIDTSLYEKNPVLLWMHRRGTVVGYLKDIEKTDTEITAEPVFDEATELSKQLKKQWEFGSLRMVSVSVDIMELSEEPEYIVQGQRYPSIVKSKLTEVSIVDIGGNDDAVILCREGKRIELSADGVCGLPMLNHINNKEMELKDIALKLGLPETATEEEIGVRIAALQDAEQQAKLYAEAMDTIAKMNAERIAAMVDGAIKETRLDASRRSEFIELGKDIGSERLRGVLGAMQPSVKLSSVLNNAPGATEWKKLSDVPEEERIRLRKEDRETYKRLYKAEYGTECEIED